MSPKFLEDIGLYSARPENSAINPKARGQTLQLLFNPILAMVLVLAGDNVRPQGQRAQEETEKTGRSPTNVNSWPIVQIRKSTGTQHFLAQSVHHR